MCAVVAPLVLQVHVAGFDVMANSPVGAAPHQRPSRQSDQF